MAILIVILFHIGNSFSANSAVGHALQTFMNMGWAGVDLFFVLSGFLITSILLKAKGSSRYFKSFYARRVLRVFPLYYSVLAFLFFVVPAVSWFSQENNLWLQGADESTAWYWLYLSNIHVALTDQFHHAVLGVAWSLAIEEHFYLVWPFIVWFFPASTLTMICASIILLSPGLRALVLSSDLSFIYVFVMTYCRLDGLAVGALIALVMREEDGSAVLQRWAKIALPLAAALLAGLVAYLRWRPEYLPGGDLIPLFGQPLMQTAGMTVLVALFGSVLIKILYADAGSLWNRFFSARVLRLLGKYSYSMYLLHSLVIIVLGTYVFDYRAYQQWPVAALLGFVLMVLLVTLVLARVTWVVIEAPMLRLKRFFPY